MVSFGNDDDHRQLEPQMKHHFAQQSDTCPRRREPGGDDERRRTTHTIFVAMAIKSLKPAIAKLYVKYCIYVMYHYPENASPHVSSLKAVLKPP